MDAFKSARKFKLIEMIINLVTIAVAFVIPTVMGFSFVFGLGFVSLFKPEWTDNMKDLLSTGVILLSGSILAWVCFVLFMIFGFKYIKGCKRLQKGINPADIYKRSRKHQIFVIVMTAVLIILAPVMCCLTASLSEFDIIGIGAWNIVGFAAAFFESAALVLAIISLKLLNNGKNLMYGNNI